MGITRSKEIELIYNWDTTLQEMRYTINGITYTDDIGKFDDIDISLIDEREKKWYHVPKIKLGNSVDVKITLNHWRYLNDRQEINLGRFYIDSFELSPPLVTFKGVSFPVDSDFKHKKRSEVIKRSTLKNIAGNIAQSYKVKLVYNAPDIPLSNIERKRQTDSEFLMSLCKDYGLKIKLYRDKLIIFDLPRYYEKAPTCTLKAINIAPNWKYKQQTQGTYTACEYEYTAEKKKNVKIRLGKGKRCLHLSGKAENSEDAKRKAIGQVIEENLKAYSLTFSTIANKKIFAGATIKIKGLGLPDGKWLVSRVTHNLRSEAYTYNVECVKVVGI